MSEKRLQKRDEISDEYKWKLEDMYGTSGRQCSNAA